MQGRRLTLPLIPQIDPTYTTNDPNPYRMVDDTVEIRLINGTRPALIGTEFLTLCSRYHWYAEWQPELHNSIAVADVRLKNGDWATITLVDFIVGTTVVEGRGVKDRIVPHGGDLESATQQLEDMERLLQGAGEEGSEARASDERDENKDDEDEDEFLRMENAIWEKAQLQDDVERAVFAFVWDAPYEDWYSIDEVLFEVHRPREQVERILQRFEARGILLIDHVLNEWGKEEAVYFTNAAYRSAAGFSHVPDDVKIYLASTGDERAQDELTYRGVSWMQANVAPPPRPMRAETTPRRSPRPLTSWSSSEAVYEDE